MTLCFADILTSFDIVQETETASASVFVFGRLRSGVIPNVHGDDVVLKLSLASTEDNNSLEIERKIYMYIHNKIVPESPHLLEGLYESECTDTAIVAYNTSKDPAERSLFKTWQKLRMKVLMKTFSEQEQKDMRSKTRELYGKYNTENLMLAYKIILPPTKVYFIVTRKMSGIPLRVLLSDPKTKMELSETDLMEIILQVAQALAVLEFHKINHHDVHYGNIFVDVLATPRKITYSNFPKPTSGQTPYSITSRYFVTLFDFDNASGAGLVNTFLTHHRCQQVAMCNEFVSNFDWFRFLGQFRQYWERKGMAVPPRVMDLFHHGDDVAQGDPWFASNFCEIEDEQEETGCKQSRLKLDLLHAIPSPETFFRENVNTYMHPTTTQNAKPVSLSAQTPTMKMQHRARSTSSVGKRSASRSSRRSSVSRRK